MNSPRSDKGNFATQEAIRLRKFSPPISAVGLGGSLGRGDADAHSDVDIFVFLDSGDVFAHASWFKKIVTHDVTPLSVGTHKFFAGYGLCISYIFDALGKVEYFLNTPASWTPDPMRANTRVIWDCSGTYTHLIDEARTAVPYLAATEAAEDAALHDLLLESLNVLKYASRRDVWSIHHRVAMMRRYLVAFQLSRNHGMEFGLQNALMRADALSPEEQVCVRGMFPTEGVISVAAALQEMARVGAALGSTHEAPDQRWDRFAENLTQAAGILSA